MLIKIILITFYIFLLSMKYQLLLNIIVCPICYKRLFLNSRYNQLVCNFDNLIFPIKKGIPVLLKKEDYDLIYKKE